MISEKFSGFITEPGSFDLTLDPSLSPFDSALEQIQPFDVIVILPGWIQHPDEFLDADLLAIARYAGPIIEIEHSQDEIHLIGQGMSWYLGDSSGIGPIIDEPINLTDAPPSDVILDDTSGLLGTLGTAPIRPGTITDTGSLGYTVVNGHQRETFRQALDIYLRARAVEARVNPNGTIDATSRGRDEVFIISTPKIFASRDAWGQDPGEFIGVECNRMLVRKDATNWVSGAEFVDENLDQLSSEDSSLGFVNIHGTNLVRILTVTSIPESLADPGQGEALAYLGSEIRLRDTFIEVEIDTNMLEMSLGNMNVGDWIWLESVEDGLIGTGVARPFRGSMRIPLKARIFEGTWPTLDGMGFYHRRSDQDPETVADRWTDLTPIVVKEYREGQSFSRLVVKLTPPSPPPWPT